MIVSELSRYLRDNRRAAVRDLAYRFDAEPDALRGMLETLERKGRVRKLPADTPCAGGAASAIRRRSRSMNGWIGTKPPWVRRSPKDPPTLPRSAATADRSPG